MTITKNHDGTISTIKGAVKLTLDEMNTGEKAAISKVSGHGAIRRRLLDMGLTPGTEIMIRKAAPLGDPIELFMRGYELTIRRSDAENIEVRGL
ncbi:MAG: ferrous iron transport protein A [Oscillospiraceae bacterium]